MFEIFVANFWPGFYYYLAVAFCLYFMSYFIEVILSKN